MVRLLEWAIANSLLVLLLAPICLLVGRSVRSPAFRHGLWILLLIKQLTPDKVLAELEGTGGRLLKTSLSHEDEAKLQAVLDAAKPQAETATPNLEKPA